MPASTSKKNITSFQLIQNSFGTTLMALAGHMCDTPYVIASFTKNAFRPVESCKVAYCYPFLVVDINTEI